MSISVEGEKCPVCHGYMFNDEDIVFCPDCGQPHHRECYNAVGHCAMQEYHGTDMQYKKTEAAGDTAAQQSNTQDVPPQNDTEAEYTETAGTENANPFGGFSGGAGAPFVINIDPYGGVNKNKVDTEENVTAEDYKNCVAVNTARYIPKFFGLGKGKRSSWNWGAFLFPQAWYFYRKCYGQGILAFVLKMVGMVLNTFGTVKLFGILGIDYLNGGFYGIMSKTQEITTALMSNQKALFAFLIASAGMIIALATHILSGIFGDIIYKKECVNKIKTVKAVEDLDEREEKAHRSYGVNIYLGAAALFLLEIIVNLILGV
ncbi:MAG: hypothetical protein KBS41_00410 [Oscillospiraceae bacterium]|nr:hypothetical protein [Candidatus Equicaccousia limihippi]